MDGCGGFFFCVMWRRRKKRRRGRIRRSGDIAMEGEIGKCREVIQTELKKKEGREKARRVGLSVGEERRVN